jgi:hypothetical protein
MEVYLKLELGRLLTMFDNKLFELKDFSPYGVHG